MLILMVGISGSGKDFFIPYAERKCSAQPVVLSSDEFRRIVSGDASNQECSKLVFDILEYNTEYLLESGFDVVLNTTALTKQTRKRFLKIAEKLKEPTLAIYIKCSLEKAKQRNDSRVRKVPHFIIEKQFAKLEVPNTEEFTDVITLDNEEDVKNA